MLTLARFRLGRILLHLVALVGGRYVRFHVEGVVRELPWVLVALNLLSRQIGKVIEGGNEDIEQIPNDGICRY